MSQFRQYILSFIFALILGLLIQSSMSFATTSIRWGSFVWDHARILPEGKTVLELKGNYQGFSDFQNSSSSSSSETLQSLNYNKKLGEAFSDSKMEGELKTWAQDNDLELDQVIASASLDVRQSVSESQLRWAHSLTSWWMLGFNVPFIRSQTQVRVNTANNRQALRQAAEKSELQTSEVTAARKMAEEQLTVAEFQKMISDLEWDSIEGEMTYQGLGNVELLSQIKLLETGPTYFSFRNRILIPAGTTDSAYQPIPLGPDTGKLNLGADLLADWSPRSDFLFSGVLGYTMQFEDTIEARVPTQNRSRWFWSIDPNVARDLGDIIVGRANSAYNVWSHVWLTVGYEYYQKMRDKYSGDMFQSQDYQQMENGTEFSRELGRIGVRYRPAVDTSMSGNNTYAAGFEYITSLASANEPLVEAASMDFQVFF